MKISRYVWAFAFVCCGSQASDGILDPTFAGTGKARVAFDDPSGNKADHAHALVVQPNGMALVMGSVDAGTQANIGFARIMANGLPDPAFNGDGNADGKIVFGLFGTVAPRGMALLSDGRIVIAGKAADGSALLTRRTANGDNTDPFPGGLAIQFAIPGAQTTEFVSLLGIENGKFLAAGTITTVADAGDYFVARFSSDGVLDPTFGSQSGYTRIAFDLDSARNDTAVVLARARDGRIAVVGTVTEGDNEFGIAMLQSNGTPDLSFDGDGKAVVNFDIGLTSDDRAAGACFAPNGNLLVAGTVSDSSFGDIAGMALLSTTGSLVSGFGNNGRHLFALFTRTQAAGVACNNSGRFLLTGTFDTTQTDLTPSEAFVARFRSDGSNDLSFGTSSATTIFGMNRPNTASPTGRIDTGVAIALRADGGAYALFDAEYQSPDFDFGLARLTGDLIFADDFQ